MLSARAAAQRTTTTFLFTDIEGSTRQWERSPGMHDRVERHFAVLREAVDAVGGEVFATMGDGIAAAFASAEAAVHAAITAQKALPALGLSVRMGVHTGEVERVGDDFRGRSVNRAARLMAVGHGGQILTSDVTATLLRTGPHPVGLADLGTHELRDLDEPERLWQVVHPDLVGEFPPVRVPSARADNLPALRSSLVGRDGDVALVTALVGGPRIVTLTGVGGVGKTRLAVQAAAEVRDRFAAVWFVELAGVAEPAAVPDAVARAVGAASVSDPLGAAAAVLGGDPALLVLDNCEHVVDHAAAVVDGLTAACPDLAVVATSREPLGLDGEHVVAVGALDPTTTAAELFRQRAGAAGADLAPADPATVEQLCTRLDGLPLAIELAAARAATLGVREVVDGLDDLFGVLSGGRRDAVARHGTLHATIEWSYRLLDADEQRLFRWLGVFGQGVELDAVRHLAASLGLDDRAATEHVTALVHRSMLVPDPQPSGLRYRMLETMRAFAVAQLDAQGERETALAALAEWVTTLTDLPYADPCNAAVERNAIRLEREVDSWREAVRFAARAGSGELAARLCGPPVAFFLLGRQDLGELVRPLLELCGDDPLRRRAVLCALLVSAAGATDPVLLRAWADEVEAVESVERTGLGGLMRWLALAWQGDFEASIEVCVAASLDPDIRQATRDLFVGIATLDHFSLTAATEDPHGLVERALEVAGRSDVVLSRVTCLLGAAWGLAGAEPDRSLELVRRALAAMDDLPALTRLTLPGSASRLLSRLDPRVAARGLLAQLDGTPAPRTYVDLIPVLYATDLLHRLGRAPAGSAAPVMPPAAPALSMMEVVDLARRTVAAEGLGDGTAAASRPGVAGLEADVRAALREIADGPAGAPPHRDDPGAGSESVGLFA